ncbi:hypothetical protein H0H93_000342 [Arthromyces matolae]|nr:hypothetical protein H0H93_000342 [Arthromyces matolae]
MPTRPTPRPCPPNPCPCPPCEGSNTVTVEIPECYRGVISGLSRSGRFQRVIVKCDRPGGHQIFRSNLVGSGENLPLRSEFDQSTGGIPFGPFDHRVTLQFTIENAQYQNGTFRPSRVIAPVTVTRAPSDHHPYHTHVTTILSEEGDDTDFNDAIITVFALA